MGAEPAGRRMREPSRDAARAISVKNARKAVAPAADPAAVAVAAVDGAAGAGTGSSAGATVAPRAESGAVGRGEMDRFGAGAPATSATIGWVERLAVSRSAEGAGVAVAVAWATAPPPRCLRPVFRCCAGLGEECEAGDFETVRLTVGATVRSTVWLGCGRRWEPGRPDGPPGLPQRHCGQRSGARRRPTA